MVKLIYTAILLTLAAKYVHSQQCEIAQTCVTDLAEEDCDRFYTIVEGSSVFGCCRSCQLEDNSGPEIPEFPPQGCQPPSSCLPDGKYAPVQCKGDSFVGRCFCNDENGRRIFGQMWRNEASEMTCACSRRRAELEAAGRIDVTIHCASNGDYEPLQCDSGLCWCAEPKTGQPTVPPMSEELMKQLPCYDEAQIGDQYLRRCETVVHAIANIHREQREHGTTFLGQESVFCDYDGSYGPFQFVQGSVFCTGREGNILGSWQTIPSEISSMNCNCARDSAVHFPERGMTLTETCQGNGNYQPNQRVGDVFYCVDTDGYAQELLDAWPTDECASYAFV